MKIKNILLIDDNEVDNYITRQILLKSNIAEHIEIQSSGYDALKFLWQLGDKPEQVPDYIFLDIMMPAMDGFDFLDQYAALPDVIKNHCTIFILSSSNSKKDIDRAASYPGVKKFLKKPFDERMLLELEPSREER